MLKIIMINFDYTYDISHLVKTFKLDEPFLLEKEDKSILKNYATQNKNSLLEKNIKLDEQTIINNFYDLKYIILKQKNCLEKNIYIELINDNTFFISLEFDSKFIFNNTFTDDDIKNKIKTVIFDLLDLIYGNASSWGTLVGIRPVKIVHDLLDKNFKFNEIQSILYEKYRLNSEKANLIMNIAKTERAYLYPIDTKSLTLYICIPFCKTRCSYCSFPSNSIEKKSNQITPYLTALLREIREILDFVVTTDFNIDCIYIGGGTPTTFTHEQLNLIFKTLKEYINFSYLKEFTVEAGRVDTIDEEKLKLFKENNVSRICINPQTMNNKTLKLIGRDHNSNDIKNIFKLARKIGHNNINMDLIIGLENEGINELKATLNEIIRLNPENITIHTLAIKRASYLNEIKDEVILSESDTIEGMLNLSKKYMKDYDYSPYYLYRQKNMLGNFENIGYSKKGFESLYNMRIIEERHTIIGFGAGSSSKFCFPKENKFERFNNIKGLEEYIKRTDELINKKILLLKEVLNTKK